MEQNDLADYGPWELPREWWQAKRERRRSLKQGKEYQSSPLENALRETTLRNINLATNPWWQSPSPSTEFLDSIRFGKPMATRRVPLQLEPPN